MSSFGLNADEEWVGLGREVTHTMLKLGDELERV